MISHVCHISGGITSWETAERVAQKEGTEHLYCIFADTLAEDNDLYRFLIESTAHVYGLLTSAIRALAATALEIPEIEDNQLELRKELLLILSRKATEAIPRLIWLCDGRTPWEVFSDVRFLGNSRVDPCSRILKRELIHKFCDQTFSNQTSVHYFGLDWDEEHRIIPLRTAYALKGWATSFPLTERPYWAKNHYIEHAEEFDIACPRLYGDGFLHNNCGGLCVKMGHGPAAILLKSHPKRYAYGEQEEGKLRTILGNVSMLTDRRGDGKKKPLTLTQFRERAACGDYDKFDGGVCSCMAVEES